jgi:hypothetical protein
MVLVGAGLAVQSGIAADDGDLSSPNYCSGKYFSVPILSSIRQKVGLAVTFFLGTRFRTVPNASGSNDGGGFAR